MKKRTALVLLTLTAVCLNTAAGGTLYHRVVIHRVVVKSDRPMGDHLFSNWYVIQVEAKETETSEEAVSKARGFRGVRYAEPDTVITLHQEVNHCSPAEWFLENFGQFGASNSVDIDVDAWGAWRVLKHGVANMPQDQPIRIAVVDSGIETTHPRFEGVQFFAQKDFLLVQTSEKDSSGHGTAVAGTVVATIYEKPSWYELGSYRVFDQNGYAFLSSVLKAFDKAVTDGAHIINFSGGTTSNLQSLRQFLENNQDVIFVFSAGNRGAEDPDYPARYHDLENVVSVSAIEQSGALTSFTNRNGVVAAPGQYIYTSLKKEGAGIPSLIQPAGYGFVAGTSFAAPITAAACAGRKILRPHENPSETRRALLMAVDKDKSYEGKILSGGRINYESLVKLP